MVKQLWCKLFGSWQDNVVVVSVPLRITDQQRAEIKANVLADLPSDAIVLVLDGGISAGTLR